MNDGSKTSLLAKCFFVGRYNSRSFCTQPPACLLLGSGDNRVTDIPASLTAMKRTVEFQLPSIGEYMGDFDIGYITSYFHSYQFSFASDGLGLKQDICVVYHAFYFVQLTIQLQTFKRHRRRPLTKIVLTGMKCHGIHKAAALSRLKPQNFVRLSEYHRSLRSHQLRAFLRKFIY